VLLLLQIPDRTVMAIMGWSNTAMAARYQHIIAAIRRDVANSVGGSRGSPPNHLRRTPVMAPRATLHGRLTDQCNHKCNQTPKRRSSPK
jgi:hypothetical protein